MPFIFLEPLIQVGISYPIPNKIYVMTIPTDFVLENLHRILIFPRSNINYAKYKSLQKIRDRMTIVNNVVLANSMKVC